jgi:hypothetical protein
MTMVVSTSLKFYQGQRNVPKFLTLLFLLVTSPAFAKFNPAYEWSTVEPAAKHIRVRSETAKFARME